MRAPAELKTVSCASWGEARSAAEREMAKLKPAGSGVMGWGEPFERAVIPAG